MSLTDAAPGRKVLVRKEPSPPLVQGLQTSAAEQTISDPDSVSHDLRALTFRKHGVNKRALALRRKTPRALMGPAGSHCGPVGGKDGTAALWAPGFVVTRKTAVVPAMIFALATNRTAKAVRTP